MLKTNKLEVAVQIFYPTLFPSARAVLTLVHYEIATKSPLAVIGTKAVLLRSRDLTVEQGLDYVATWNSGTLLSDDLKEAISAHSQKRKPKFAKL
ncbi:hypothetical protein MTR67_022673 [Solanum verrucosum]|uniref:Uncharacterized protein n=1 Tax=Solanum verrucosum TaxID=315347 RepID=A0AAF0TY28_SOLVR|nr:hypothetical protein MTR67_022673 [Solanum verrucosum]